jgi:hypothetical protein
MNHGKKWAIGLMIAGTLIFLESLVGHHATEWYNAAGLFVGYLVGAPRLIDCGNESDCPHFGDGFRLRAAPAADRLRNASRPAGRNARLRG